MIKQQSKQFRRLERLSNKTNLLCEDLSLDSLVLDNAKLSSSQPGALNQTKLEEFQSKQEALLRKINSLGDRCNQICQDMNLNSLIVDLKSLDLTDNTHKSTQTGQKQVKHQQNRTQLQVDLAQFKDVKRASSKTIVIYF